MQEFIRKALILLLVVLIAGCSTSRQQRYMNTDSLAGLQAMANNKKMLAKKNKAKMSNIREMALREIALGLGAQAGLAHHAQLIDDELVKKTRELDEIYNFNALVLEHNILPPVLLEGRNTFNLASAQAIRISDRTYKVYKQARFITTPPNWRHYLWMDFKKPDFPNKTLLPKTKEEKQVWRRYINQGWQSGKEQANAILEESLARIKEDFTGMILYRKLLAMNMVSPPYVAHTDLGVTGDGNEIHIDDRVLRITALPALNSNAGQWRAAVTKDEATLDKLDAMQKMVQGNKLKIASTAWQPIIAATQVKE